ncbi:hypothetical protein SELMODRAFT_420344 [Selaginella moellendorffii]|uniref:Uncharacterized protein n=1 Tax=Selaginella moellendorffii TaxID=88036 RepID=D8SBP8_SELML|nr:hypothetical protein SELMODRAFT_420344 [Selaginella moellendorffii]
MDHRKPTGRLTRSLIDRAQPFLTAYNGIFINSTFPAGMNIPQALVKHKVADEISLQQDANFPREFAFFAVPPTVDGALSYTNVFDASYAVATEMRRMPSTDQLKSQVGNSCYFDGLGKVTDVDPAQGDCKFKIGIVTASSPPGLSAAMSLLAASLAFLFLLFSLSQPHNSSLLVELVHVNIKVLHSSDSTGQSGHTSLLPETVRNGFRAIHLSLVPKIVFQPETMLGHANPILVALLWLYLLVKGGGFALWRSLPCLHHPYDPHFVVFIIQEALHFGGEGEGKVKTSDLHRRIFVCTEMKAPTEVKTSVKHGNNSDPTGVESNSLLIGQEAEYVESTEGDEPVAMDRFWVVKYL